MLEIDENGLDEMDKRILEAVIVKFGGGPVGVSSLAVAVGEEPDTLGRSIRALLDHGGLSEAHVPRPRGHRGELQKAWFKAVAKQPAKFSVMLEVRRRKPRHAVKQTDW